MSGRIPGKGALLRAYDEIAAIHKQRLAKRGVKLPPKSSRKWVWLAMLHYHRGGKVHKDEISDAVQKIFPGSGRDQQARHLKRDGWNVAGDKGFHSLVDASAPSPEFETDKTRRRGRLSASDFDGIKKAFNNCCVTCGAAEGEPNIRYGKVQQGHQDPDAPADLQSNIIPQCQFCNRAYRRDFVFDDKGRAKAVADVRPVRQARKHVQKKIWQYLRNLFR